MRDSIGKVSGESNQDITLRHARRLVIHKTTEHFEYALPSNLKFWISPQASSKNDPVLFDSQMNSNAPVAFALGGRWRLSMLESNLLDVVCIKGGDVSAVPDHTRPAIGFPLRPRKPNETFEQYKAGLEEAYRAALRK